MRVGLDSNILVYLAGGGNSAEDLAKANTLGKMIEQLADRVELVVPVQAIGELLVVLHRLGFDPVAARASALEFAQALATPPSTATTMFDAFDLVVDHRMQLWDALILCAVAEAGCELLLSEDMQDGFVARGVTVINPLAKSLHPKLKTVLESN